MTTDENKNRGCRTLKETAEYIGVGYASMCEIARREGFPAFKVGRKTLVPCDALEKWLSEQVVKY